jgi:Fe-Mn family superoxide dismutase
MKLHHSKHHQAYVNGLNAAEEAYVKTQSTKEKIALQAALKFNGGGEYLP